MKIPTPAYVHSDMTYLDAIKYEFGLIEHTLFRCQKEGILESPFERLKHLVAAQIGAMRYGIEGVGLKSPLNPILGETRMMTTPKGSRLYCEQTSHHPPISHFLMEGPPELPFSIDGYMEVKLGVRGMFSSVLFQMAGVIRLRLPDKTLIEMSPKAMEISGLLSSEKVFNLIETMTINDVTNGVNAEIIFDCNKEKRAGYVTSFFKSEKVDEQGNQINRSDLIDIKLTDDADFEIGRGSGSYLENV